LSNYTINKIYFILLLGNIEFSLNRFVFQQNSKNRTIVGEFLNLGMSHLDKRMSYFQNVIQQKMIFDNFWKLKKKRKYIHKISFQD
jgi:hypothetical protein